MSKNRFIGSIIIILVALSFGLSYFVRPKVPVREIVSAAEITIEPPGQPTVVGMTLADRVQKSFSLGLVLVQSEYSAKNAAGLESIRLWAQPKFQENAAFLHPITLSIPVEVQHSIFDSFFYNLFAAPYYWLQDRITDGLCARISEFHDSSAYDSFRNDYIGVFGQDLDSMLLLARYESDRARSAVNVVLCAAFWFVVTICGAILFVTSREGTRSSRGQRLLAYGWIITGLLYVLMAAIQNHVAVLISALVCLLGGFYLRRPVKLHFNPDKMITLELLSPNAAVIALIAWISITLLGIRLLTWIKTGSLSSPDPVTLLACSFSGDFVHDPIHAKRNLSTAIGLIWLTLTGWVTYYVGYDPKEAREVEQKLASLEPLH